MAARRKQTFVDVNPKSKAALAVVASATGKSMRTLLTEVIESWLDENVWQNGARYNALKEAVAYAENRVGE